RRPPQGVPPEERLGPQPAAHLGGVRGRRRVLPRARARRQGGAEPAAAAGGRRRAGPPLLHRRGRLRAPGDPGRRGPPAARPETFSFHYDLDTGKPRIDTPGFVYALRLLQRLQRCRPGGAGGPAEAFRDGKAVLCLTDAAWLPAFQKSAAVRD